MANEFKPDAIVVVKVIKVPGRVSGTKTTMPYAQAKARAERKEVEIVGESTGLLFTENKKAKDEGRK